MLRTRIRECTVLVWASGGARAAVEQGELLFRRSPSCYQRCMIPCRLRSRMPRASENVRAGSAGPCAARHRIKHNARPSCSGFRAGRQRPCHSRMSASGSSHTRRRYQLAIWKVCGQEDGPSMSRPGVPVRPKWKMVRLLRALRGRACPTRLRASSGSRRASRSSCPSRSRSTDRDSPNRASFRGVSPQLVQASKRRRLCI